MLFGGNTKLLSEISFISLKLVGFKIKAKLFLDSLTILKILLITKSNSYSVIHKKRTYNNDLISMLPTSILSNRM